jgi:hypothetical protein
MDFKREDFETLRLLRAFRKVTDPAKRRKIIELVETEAQKPKPDSEPDLRPGKL